MRSNKASVVRSGSMVFSAGMFAAGLCVAFATCSVCAQPADAGVDARQDADASSPQDSGANASQLSAAIQPPVLIAEVPAVYPETARANGLEGTVLLRLTIDAQGFVTEAEVLEPLGHELDEAARTAALQLRFEPARRSGAAVPARIRYPYEFRLPPAAAPVGSPATLASQPAPAPRPALPPSAAVDVTVAGARSEAERLQQSAAAVNVVDTRRAQRQTADLGEVLARTQGVAVRRDGGLGTASRFSLNGLYDEQVRFFVDEIPLEIAGFPLGITNVPVNLVERVEVYRGVVPVRFGADALGGAVNLVTDQRYRQRLAASYQVGSFGTQRMTIDGRYRHAATGVIAGVTGFFDITKNDYDITVPVADARGRSTPTTLPRFHDGYNAYGATLEVGVVDRPWAKRLLVRGTLSSYDKELAHNIVMTVPYGDVHYGEQVYGASARYEVTLAKDWALEVVGSYAYRVANYVDEGQWVYDWKGQRVRERSAPGEVEGRAHDQLSWQHSWFGRALVTWSILPEHKLRASLAPAFAARRGDERIQADPSARDPLSAQRDLFTFVSGLEYELSAWRERVANVLFVKDYYYQANSEEPLAGGNFRKRDSDTHSQGLGDSLRVRITPWLYAKASYEYATRLPSPYEVFGNGVLVRANLALEPEVSHNANLGPRLELTQTPWGALTVDINAFWRHSDRLIVLLGNDRYFTYENVYEARGLGLENAASWSAPERWLTLDGMFSWQDVRNVSSKGGFGAFEGDRIPNRPYMFASWGARARLPALSGPRDSLEPFYSGRYVHAFFRSWESQGLREYKQTVDAQVTQSVGVSWTLQRDYLAVTTTLELDNLTDARVYDNFGVQRPGRAFYVKVTGELR